MSNIINVTPQRVQISESFDTQKAYLYADTDIKNQESTRLFTKTLKADSLKVFLEQDNNLKTKISVNESYPDDYPLGGYREDYGPAIPTRGPFLSYYSVTGSSDLKLFANLLLIDKPPISEGFYQFFIQGTSFHGLIRQLKPYDHYDWEVTNKFGRGRYGYVKKSNFLGYAIEIANNQIYDSYEVLDGDAVYYRAVPNKLKSVLESLTGEEEITSGPPSFNAKTFNEPVQGLTQSLDKAIGYNDNDGYPIYDFTRGYDLFAISDANALYYIASYPDLIQAFGADPVKGRNHYNRNARKEGRSITFDPIAYINKYADIKQIYGTDTVGATTHYIVFGFKEGRTISSASNNLTSRGGLYDERYTTLGEVNDDVIIWPNGRTMAGKGRALTYRFLNTSYYLNGLVDVPDSSIYLRKQ